ncbi:hypothetical protein ABZ366_19715 [Streptomyces sp. NPDC005904]|uniref:hypothetical protein n=1 Tax=Streptomyces sp. NPDC005904 TaxID=3154570 RepID=UPI0033FFC15A
MRLGKALATGIAEEQPRQEETARADEAVRADRASASRPGPKAPESVPEPRPVEAAVTR